MTMLTMIEANAQEYPQKLALTALDENITYSALWENIVNTAGNLTKLGVSPGDKILFSVKPSVDSIVFAMGAIAMGAAIVFADLHDNSTSWEKRLELLKPQYVVADSSVYALNTIFFKKRAAKMKLSIPDYAKLSGIGFFHIGMRLIGTPRHSINVKALAQKESTNLYEGTGNEAAIIFFVPESGDKPRAIVHSLNSLSAGIPEALSEMGLNVSSKVFTYHFMFGIAVLCGGGWWAIPRYNAKHETDNWFKELKSAQWTHSFMIPADIETMLKCIKEQGNPPEIENLFAGAAPVLPNLIIRAGLSMPKTRFHSVYGMKEVFPVSVTGVNDKLFNNVYDYAGHPFFSCNVSIHEPNNEGVGEIVISGPSLMVGYLGEPPTTEYKTGDLGIRTESGALLLLGQQKDSICRDSHIIYPGLYEPLMEELEGIDKAILVGVGNIDEENSEHVVLFVVGENPAIEQLPENIKAILPSTVLPDTTIRIDAIPCKGRSLKPDRETLRDTALNNPYIQKMINKRKEQL